MEAPSSTLFAMDQAVSAGADALELDLHPTSDGRIVIMHDDTIDAYTNASGLVRQMTLAELRTLDMAYNFVPEKDNIEGVSKDEADAIYRGRGPEDPLFSVVTLDDVLQRYPDRYLNLDIKENLGDEIGYEAMVADLIVKAGAVDRTIVASFLHEVLERFRVEFPSFSTSASPIEALEFYDAYMNNHRPEKTPFEALQIPAVYSGVEYLDGRFVSFAHDLGIAVHVWTINDVDLMKRMIEIGVDGIMTDRPSVLADVLAGDVA